MIKKVAVVLAAAIVAIVLAGCDPNGKVSKAVILPQVPVAYRTCASAELTKIPGNAVTRAQLVRLLADVRKDSLRDKGCLRGLVKWYDNVRVEYAKQK